MGRTGRELSASGRRSSPLWSAFAAQSARTPDALAVACLDPSAESGAHPWRYRDLEREATAMAERLVRAGLGEGDVVALALPNSFGFVAAFLALARLGTTVLLVSPRYGMSEVSAIAARTRPTAWLGPAVRGVGLASLASEPAAWDPLGPGLTLLRAGDHAAAPPFDGEDAVVKFSSGSTGEPKGVRLGAAALLIEAENIARTLALAPGDRVHARVPLVHSYGFDLGLLAPLLAGASLHLGEGFIPRLALRELPGMSLFLGVPSMYRLFLETREEVDLGTLRWALSCTAPLSPAIIGEVHARFGVAVVAHYGASECGAAANHEPSAVLRRPESVGRAVAGVTLRIVDAGGRAIGPDEVGEVTVESGALARGLLGRENADLPFVAGPDGTRRYHTGDLGQLDADGFLTLHGRLDLLINVGGLKVSPFEVEAVLESHPAVREALVRAERGADSESFPIALVTLRTSTTEADLLRFCHGRLADHKLPRRIEVRDRLPLGPGGKLDRRPQTKEETS